MPNIDDFIQRFSLTSNSSILFSTCLAFDPSMVELFLSIKLGAQLIIPPKEIIGGISHSILKKFEKINFVQTTPALLQCLSTNCLNFIFGPNSSIEFLLIGGATFPLNLIRRYINYSTRTRIFNVYGITEVSCWASCFEFNCENIRNFSNDSITIGNPLLKTKFDINEEKILQIYGRKCFVNFSINKEEPTNTGDIAFIKIINEEKLICVKSRYKPQSQLPSLELETFILNAFPQINFSKLVFVGACKFLFLKADGEVPGINTKNILTKIPKRLWPTRIFCMGELNIRSDFLTLNGKIDETKLIDYIKLNYYNKFTSLLNFLNKNYNIPLNPTLSNLSSSLRYYGIGSLEAVEICFYLENFSSYSSKNIFETFGDKMQFILDENTTLGNFLKIFENCQENGNQINIVEDTGKEEKCLKFELINSTLKSKECWNVDLGKCIDGTPVCSDGVIYAASHLGVLKGISLISGSTMFNYIAENDRFEAGCVVNQHYMAIGIWLKFSDFLIFFIYLGGFSGNLLVFENNLITNQQPLLTISCSSEIRMTPIFDQKFNLIWGDYSGIIYNLNIQNGELKQIFNCAKHLFGSLRTSPLLDNNLIIFATLNGFLFAIDKISGQLYWQTKLDSPIFAQPISFSVDDNRSSCIALTVKGGLYCVKISDGDVACQINLNNNTSTTITNTPTFFDSPTPLNSPNYFLISAGKSHLLLIKYNELNNNFELIKQIILPDTTCIVKRPLILNEDVFVLNSTGSLFLLKSETLISNNDNQQQPLAAHLIIDLKAETFGHPIILPLKNNSEEEAFNIVIGTRKNLLHCFVFNFLNDQTE
ncbi:unnamed protein product [Meloidogyne enterolobii]|uniref:Uncharacterized protein n=1 Tax=Meloidogyne enterolobii TaxID=390850 RepID=A0ACB1AS09_MELEN